MRRLILCLFLSSSFLLVAQVPNDTLIRGNDTIILVDPTLPQNVITLELLSEAQVRELREVHGIFPVRVVDQPGTYCWSDLGVAGGTVTNAYDETIKIARYINPEFGIDRYVLCFESYRSKFPPVINDIGAYRDVPKP